jgi:DNA-directed RNA polymerase subunit RPC12/RpoP
MDTFKPEQKPVYACPHCQQDLNQKNIIQVMEKGRCPHCQKVMAETTAQTQKVAADMHFQMLTILVRNFYLFGPIGFFILFILAAFLLIKPFLKKSDIIIELSLILLPGICGIISGHFIAKKIIRQWAIKRNKYWRKKFNIPKITYQEYMDLY